MSKSNVSTTTIGDSKYEKEDKLAEGSSGLVFSGKNVETGEDVAIKRRKKKFRQEEIVDLNEIQALKKLKHKNIIELEDFFLYKDGLFLIFPLMDATIEQLIKNQKQPFPEESIKAITKDIATGLNFMHKKGLFHRNLRPANILCNGFGEDVKIADFCLAHEIKSKKNDPQFVSDRMYRAPEILLLSEKYNWPIDIWALGCILAEMYLLKGIFNETSDSDQLIKISSVLGVPTKQDWPEGHQLADETDDFSWPTMETNNKQSSIVVYQLDDGSTMQRTSLAESVPGANRSSIKLLEQMLVWNPNDRLSSDQVIKSKFLSSSGSNDGSSDSSGRSSRAGSRTGRRKNKHRNESMNSSRGSSNESRPSTGDRKNINRDKVKMYGTKGADRMRDRDRPPSGRGDREERGKGGKSKKSPIQISVDYENSNSRGKKIPPNLVLKLQFAGPNYGTFVFEPED